MNTTLMAALVAALVAPFALASHTPTGRCSVGDELALGVIEIGNGDPSATFYVDDRNYVLGNGIWLYQETNGNYGLGDRWHNLQRGGASPYAPDDPEICVDDPVSPDLLIF